MKKKYTYLLLSSLFLNSVSVLGLTYEEAKQNKYICENTDGFVKKNIKILASQNDSLKNEVDKIILDVNTSRMNIYDDIAAKNNTSRITASSATAAELIKNAPCNCQQDDVECR